MNDHSHKKTNSPVRAIQLLSNNYRHAVNCIANSSTISSIENSGVELSASKVYAGYSISSSSKDCKKCSISGHVVVIGLFINKFLQTAKRQDVNDGLSQWRNWNKKRSVYAEKIHCERSGIAHRTYIAIRICFMKSIHNHVEIHHTNDLKKKQHTVSVCCLKRNGCLQQTIICKAEVFIRRRNNQVIK